jgi:hypothetical protein
MVSIAGNQSRGNATKECFNIEAADIMILYALQFPIFALGAWTVFWRAPQQTQMLEVSTLANIHIGHDVSIQNPDCMQSKTIEVAVECLPVGKTCQLSQTIDL